MDRLGGGRPVDRDLGELVPRTTAPFTVLGKGDLRAMGPVTARLLNTVSAETTQLTEGPGAVAATTRPLIPATTMVTGSTTAATTGRQNATTTASRTAATVHRRSPNSTGAIAATGTSRMPRPRRRRNRPITRHTTVTRIPMSPIVTPPGRPALWGRT